MGKRTGILFVLFLLSVSLLSAEVFKYKYFRGEKYKIKSEVNESVYINGQYHHAAEILNKIAVEVVSTEEGSGMLDATFSTSEKRKGNVDVYELSQEYHSLFQRDQYGKLNIDYQYYMPVVRDVPLFKEKDIKKGESWYGDGWEVHDLRNGYGIQEPFRYPIHVRYTYLGKGQKDGKTYDILTAYYSISYNTPDSFSRYRLYPVQVTGYSDQTIFWNSEEGKPYAYEEEFSIRFILSSGDSYTFRGTAGARVTASEKMNKELLADSLKNKIEQEKLSDMSVTVDDKGVTITLSNIHFKADSTEILEPEKRKLDLVADKLREYPGRDVLITGYTALAGTPEGRKQLSEDRARVVAGYFIESGAKPREQIVIRGLGAENPVADNSTPEGKQKNRRVEITILEN